MCRSEIRASIFEITWTQSDLVRRRIESRDAAEMLTAVQTNPLPCKICWPTTTATARLPEAVPEKKEVVAVNAESTRVLPSGVAVGR